MFKEILYIVPKLATDTLGAMERTLNSRFANVARKFGKGLVAGLTGGGIVGAGLGLIDKLLNPLKETQDAIDRTLKHSDDLVTNAKQFGTTAGKLARLQALAQSTGLDAESLNMLLAKFQTSVAEAKADPTKQTSVRQFANDKDTAESFFQFIQALQKMDKSKQVLVQQEVFGEKQILRMADFLQTNFGAQTKALGGPTAAQLDRGANRLGDLNDRADLLAARRGLTDLVAKSRIINQGMVDSADEQAKRELERENNNIKAYNDLASVSVAVAEMGNTVRNIANTLSTAVVRFYDIANVMKKINDSPVLRGVIKFIKAE